MEQASFVLPQSLPFLIACFTHSTTHQSRCNIYSWEPWISYEKGTASKKQSVILCNKKGSPKGNHPRLFGRRTQIFAGRVIEWQHLKTDGREVLHSFIWLQQLRLIKANRFVSVLVTLEQNRHQKRHFQISTQPPFYSCCKYKQC